MKILISIMAAALFYGSAAADEPKKAADENAWKTRVFTAAELKKCDGKDGAPAYVAVDGIVYDMSKSKAWKDGRHVKMHHAGADLSSALHDQAPKAMHKNVMAKVPKVGVMEGYGAEKTASAPAQAVASKPQAAMPPQTVDPKPQAAVPAQAGDPKPLTAIHRVSKEEIGLKTSCPVTGDKITVSEKTPALDFKGKTYYFSKEACVEMFSKAPGKYLDVKEKAAALLKKKKS